MKVKDLKAQLDKLDPDLEVLGYSEDQELLRPKHSFRLLDIDEVSVTEATKMRCEDRDRTPSLKFGKGPHSQKVVLLGLLADF